MRCICTNWARSEVKQGHKVKFEVLTDPCELSDLAEFFRDLAELWARTSFALNTTRLISLRLQLN